MHREIIHTAAAPQALGPYSQAIRTGSLVFTSGQVAIDPQTGQLVPGDITAQTHQVFANLKAVLAAAGTSLDRVAKATCFLRSMDDFKAFIAAYAQYLGEIKPARSTFAVSALPLNAAVEVELIATCA